MRPASGLRKVREGTTLRRSLVPVVIVATLAGCSGSSLLPPPAVPPDEVGGLRPATTTTLTAEDVASEAVDAGVLADLLELSGFQGGVRRSYTGGGLGIRRVDVRILHFASSDGASIYLEWLHGNTSDLIGEIQPPDRFLFGDVPVYVHTPDGCCPREPAVALAAWTRDRQVIRVLVSGAVADGRRAAKLIREVRVSMRVTVDA